MSKAFRVGVGSGKSLTGEWGPVFSHCSWVGGASRGDKHAQESASGFSTLWGGKGARAARVGRSGGRTVGQSDGRTEGRMGRMIRSRTTDDSTLLAKDAKRAKGRDGERPSSSPFHPSRDRFGVRVRLQPLAGPRLSPVDP